MLVCVLIAKVGNPVDLYHVYNTSFLFLFLFLGIRTHVPATPFCV